MKVALMDNNMYKQISQLVETVVICSPMEFFHWFCQALYVQKPSNISAVSVDEQIFLSSLRSAHITTIQLKLSKFRLLMKNQNATDADL